MAQGLRVRGAQSWSGVLMAFVLENLPNLLNSFREGQEAEALESLAKLWREKRTEHMTDRTEQIAEGRKAVDARLEQRKQSRDK